jgi:sugar transferase (PEP-CTERM/EpsH1 system associated)
VGGLENGVVNLINRMPAEAYRHAVISLTDITQFTERITQPGVEFVALAKEPGHGVKLYPRLYKLFRRMRPAIVHTRNLAALEAAVPAWLAAVPTRVHGEHGRDVGDLDGASRKYQWIRRLYRPFVTRYVAVSRDLEDYLITKVGVPASRISQLYNGVDAQRFMPSEGSRRPIHGCPFRDPGLWLVGTVGRMEPVKDQLTLVRAFIRALQIDPSQQRLRLVMVGGGTLHARAAALLKQADLSELSWLPGERNDVPAILRGLDCFVLPSLAEGISNTILEAMATGLPVIATDVGGNRELVEAGRTGAIVPAGDPEALARQILTFARSPHSAALAGRAGRTRAERVFSLDAMVSRYKRLYDGLIAEEASRLMRGGRLRAGVRWNEDRSIAVVSAKSRAQCSRA